MGDLPGLLVGQILGDVALLAPVGVIDPLLGPVEPAVQGGMPLGRGIGQEDAELAVFFLAQATTPLASHAAAVLALLGEGGGVQDDDALGIGQFLGDMATHLGDDRLVVPGPWPTNIWRFFRGMPAPAAMGSTDLRLRPLSRPRTKAEAWPRCSWR